MKAAEAVQRPDLARVIEPFIERIVQALTAPKDPGPRFVSVDQAAQLLGLSGYTVKKLCKEGKLAAIRDKRQWAVLRSAIAEWKP